MAIAWRNLTNRVLQSFMTILVVGLAVALALVVVLLSEGVQTGINRAAEPYDLIIGGKGSAQQLVINTVLLQGNPLQNVPFELYEKLQTDPGLTSVVPLGYGDNYHKHKIVGTKAQFFDFRNKPNDPLYFQLGQGRVFRQPFEAVIGAEAAKKLGLTPGQKFNAEHGDEVALPGEEDHDDHEANPYTVVGILKPTDSPADLGIYVDIASYWKIHEHAAPPVGDPTGPNAVTAILVKPKVFPNDLYRVQNQINSGRLTREAQAVIPYNELYNLNQLVGQGQQILSFGLYCDYDGRGNRFSVALRRNYRAAARFGGVTGVGSRPAPRFSDSVNRSRLGGRARRGIWGGSGSSGRLAYQSGYPGCQCYSGNFRFSSPRAVFVTGGAALRLTGRDFARSGGLPHRSGPLPCSGLVYKYGQKLGSCFNIAESLTLGLRC